MNILRKTIFSLLITSVLFACFFAAAYAGFLDIMGPLNDGEDIAAFSGPVKIIILASIFITAFLIVFLCFNLKQSSPPASDTLPAEDKAPPEAGPQTDSRMPDTEPEELENADIAGTAVSIRGCGLLAAAQKMQGADVIIEQNGIPYIKSDYNGKIINELDNDFEKLVDSVISND